MPEALGANGGLSAEEVSQLMGKAKKGDKKALPACDRLSHVHAVGTAGTAIAGRTTSEAAKPLRDARGHDPPSLEF